MRVTTAFNNLLGLPGRVGQRRLLQRRGGRRVGPIAASATGVRGLRPDRAAAGGPRPAGQALAASGPRRQPLHHRVRTAAAALPRLRRALEPVPWARPGAAHTRDFEDVVAWLAQQMAKTPIAGLLRIALGHRRADRRARGRRAPRRAPPRRPRRDRRRRDQLPPRPALSHVGRRPPRRRDRVVRAGPQRRNLAGVLRRARRPQALDPGGLDRHVRRL